MKRIFLATSLALLAAGCGRGSEPAARPRADAVPAAPRAACGPGSRPETGIQGRVPLAEHESGRAAEGYTCNTELVGSYTIPNPNGTVAGFKVHRYVDAAGHECAYYDTSLHVPFGFFDQQAGVNVLDMSDPANPVLTETLRTPAMVSPHESLVLSESRGLLAAVAGTVTTAPGVVDIYDVTADCRHPVLQSVTPVGFLGHESGISPDGKTLYAASPGTPTVTAIDISDPLAPVPLATLPYYSHGISVSDDGNRLYMSCIGLSGSANAFSGGQVRDVPDPGPDRALVIADVSQIQARVPAPQVAEIARFAWSPMSIPQNSIPVTIKGRPYLIEIDEYGQQVEVGAGRIIDISDETRPAVVSNLRLEVHQPENFAAQAEDPGATFSGQGYAGHYCNVPSLVDPPIVACSMIMSGLRIFDIRDPFNPREVAYFNAPAPAYPRAVPQPTAGGGYAMSQPAFVPERKEIWYSDVYSGFYVVRVTNGVWP